MAASGQITVYIQYAAEKKLSIAIPSEKCVKLTCKWLLEEAVSKLKALFPQKKEYNSIVALQTVDREFAVDHWLTMPFQNLSILKDEIVLKPFYGESQKNAKDDETKISLDDFIVESKLGLGSFSNVYLVRKKETGALYALKQIKKTNMTPRKNKLIFRELQAMLSLNSSHIIKFHYSFQTETHCYFVLDFVPGGDLLHFVHKKKLTDNDLRFYIGEVILGLSVIHSESYIYRDLKPENLLIDFEGHIHITDFGLAKRVKNLRDFNRSVCGTFEVLAPEVDSKAGYDFMVDYYNIGTLAYELATGKIPVFSGDERRFLESENPEFASLSAELKDFITELLEPAPQSRLGFRGGFKEICSHPWLSKLNMSYLNQRIVKTPFTIDPWAVKFDRSPVPVDIDLVLIKISSRDTASLNNFSFYGSLRSCSTANTLEKIRFGSGSLDRELEIIENTPKIWRRTLSRDRKKEDEETMELDSVDESVAKKIICYKPLSTKGMKVMAGFPKVGKI